MLKSLFPWKHSKTKQVMAAQQTMDEGKCQIICHFFCNSLIKNVLQCKDKNHYLPRLQLIKVVFLQTCHKTIRQILI